MLTMRIKILVLDRICVNKEHEKNINSVEVVFKDVLPFRGKKNEDLYLSDHFGLMMNFSIQDKK